MHRKAGSRVPSELRTKGILVFFSIGLMSAHRWHWGIITSVHYADIFWGENNSRAGHTEKSMSCCAQGVHSIIEEIEKCSHPKVPVQQSAQGLWKHRQSRDWGNLGSERALSQGSWCLSWVLNNEKGLAQWGSSVAGVRDREASEQKKQREQGQGS